MQTEFTFLLQHSKGQPLGFITKSRNETDMEEFIVRDVLGEIVARESIIDRLHDEILPALQGQLESTARQVQRTYDIEHSRGKGRGKDKDIER